MKKHFFCYINCYIKRGFLQYLMNLFAPLKPDKTYLNQYFMVL
jgi:hypothetical protein